MNDKNKKWLNFYILIYFLLHNIISKLYDKIKIDK